MLIFIMQIYINKYITELQAFSVKGSTSNRSWLVYNPILTAIYDTIKCEDDISLSYQADSSQSKAVLPPPPDGGPLCFKL